MAGSKAGDELAETSGRPGRRGTDDLDDRFGRAGGAAFTAEAGRAGVWLIGDALVRRAAFIVTQAVKEGFAEVGQREVPAATRILTIDERTTASRHGGLAIGARSSIGKPANGA